MGLSLCHQLCDRSISRDSRSSSSLSSAHLPNTLPVRLSVLLHSPPDACGKPCSLWSVTERSPHLHVREGGVCVWRQPIEQSSDAIRSSGGIKEGLHLWEVTWEADQRGSHALIGVCTRKSSWHVSGYTALVGGDSHSWGWELSSNQLWHKGKEAGRYPAEVEQPMDIPKSVVVAVDVDAGTLAYVVEGCYLGVAFTDLPKGEELFLAVSCVWGGASIRMRYLGGMSRDPPSLMSVCSLSINQTLGRSRASLIDRLPLPAVLQHFLEAHQWPAEAQACINMKGFVMQQQENGELHNAILVENYNAPDVKGGDVLDFFKQMLTSCVVRFGKRTFRQVCGIPQGSVVSTMLCNLCYGHMENSLLSHVTEKGGCLMRLVDDFLLITPKLSKAMYFLKTLLAGVPQYGCVVNPQKVAVNFPLEEGVSFPGVRVLPQHCLFPWCGLLLDTQTLDVSNDYSSYAGLSLRYSLTLGSTPHPAVFMRRKLLSILRLKCDAILLDLGTNSLETVYKNLYKIVLLQAMRFNACVQGLPKAQTVETSPSFFLKMIWAMARTTFVRIKHNNQDTSLGSVTGGCLRLQAVQLLYCLAFEWVFVRHRDTYRCLLPSLRQRKRHLERLLSGMRLARVLQAATPRIPPDFKAIRA